MEQVPQKVLNWLHSVLIGEYIDVNRTFQDVAQSLAAYNSLRPSTEVYTFDNGSSALLLHLTGTLPVSFRGGRYSFPVSVWVPKSYPTEAPIAFVVPTQEMVIRAGQHVSGEGRIYHPYLANWRPQSQLSEVLRILQDIFSREPPVVAKPSGTTRLGSQPGAPPRPALPNELRRDSPSQRNGPPPPPPPPKPFEQRPVSSQFVDVSVQPRNQPLAPRPIYNQSPQQWRQDILQNTLHQPGPQFQDQGRAYSQHPSYQTPASNSHQIQYHSAPGANVHAGSMQAQHMQPPQQATNYGPPPVVNVPKPQTIDLLTSPFDPPLPTQAANLPAPPIPPNPEKDALLSAISQTLTAQLQNTVASNNSAIQPLSAQHMAMTQAMHNLQQEKGALLQLQSLLDSNEKILHQAMHEADECITSAQHKTIPGVDEVLVAPTVVGQQLYNLIAEEKACVDTREVLARALDRGRISSETWVKTVRSLAREEFLKKVLIRQCADGMGLQMDTNL